MTDFLLPEGASLPPRSDDDDPGAVDDNARSGRAHDNAGSVAYNYDCGAHNNNTWGIGGHRGLCAGCACLQG